MTALDARGTIAAAEVGVYAFVGILTMVLVARNGCSRHTGWIFLVLFSVVRLVGAAILLAAELSKSKSVGVYTTAFIFESIGLSPLLLATLGFLGIVGQITRSGEPLMYFQLQILRVIRLLLGAALILGVVGGAKASSSSSSNPTPGKMRSMRSGIKLRKASAIMFAALYAIILYLHLFFWRKGYDLFLHRRALLTSISTALPFLAVRTIYAVLSAFSPNTGILSSSFSNSSNSSLPANSSNSYFPTNSSFPTNSTNTTSLSKFNPITGSWPIFLGMSVVMEFAVVVIYVLTGMVLPLHPREERDRYPMEYMYKR